MNPGSSATDPIKGPTHGNDTLGDLRRRIQENEAQRTEITGYINQLNIQLLRWQLRLQKLSERRTELETEKLRLSSPRPESA
jgi:chromosome segregation ATPase